MARTTTNSKTIKASANTIYQAFTNPSALEVWQVPGNMTAKVHNFDLKVGGGYEMSLFYPESEKKMQGKTQGKEDRFTARFVELIPNRKIVQVVNFQSPLGSNYNQVIMKTKKSNKEIITEIFTELSKGNDELFLDTMSEDMQWNWMGSGQWSKSFVENQKKS